MTTTEINEAIHRHLGHELVELTEMIYANGKVETKWIMWRDKNGNKTAVDSIPNYCGSLDAMAIAEDKIRTEKSPETCPNYYISLYGEYLAKIANIYPEDHEGYYDSHLALSAFATPIQRAEAYLRTFNLLVGKQMKLRSHRKCD